MLQQAVAEHRHAALRMATGTGKTAVSCAWMLERKRAAQQGAGAGAAPRRARFLVLVHRLCLQEQWDDGLQLQGLSTLLVGTAHSYPEGEDRDAAGAAEVVVCEYNSFGGRLEREALAGGFDAVFIDEAHRITRDPASGAWPGRDDSDVPDTTYLDKIRGLIAAPDAGSPWAGLFCVPLRHHGPARRHGAVRLPPCAGH